MSGIRAVLRHRATVRRSDNLIPATWSIIQTALPCLLDSSAGQPDPIYVGSPDIETQRLGKLFTLPSAAVQPGDRISLTRGATGTYLVRPDPYQVSDLNAVHHNEYVVEQVASSAP